ncbi:MAG: sialate O-acetylesterase [Flavobacterium sp.]|nr:sialate O-acetylesterase [Flavobacterium sp.]
MRYNVFKLLFFIFISQQIKANIVLPNIFTDNMVLQRNADVKMWGWANPSEEVVIKTSWDNSEYKIKGNNQAYWEISIHTPQAGGPYNITAKGYNEVQLSNIMIGEVWICSGQSNMEMTASWGIKNGEEEVKNANHPNIRIFTVSKAAATSPQNNLVGNWQSCSADVMKNSSAVAYFFAQKLQQDLNGIPIGIIVSAWGGTPAEIWIPQEVIQNNKELLASANRLAVKEYGPNEPGRAFNAMINPLTKYKIAGVLWYQGESNVGANHYGDTLSALIGSWRNLWNYNFPFYIVQIAPYNYGEDNFDGVIIRDAQRKIPKIIPNTGIVVISDIATIDDIHPKDKKPVGIRLANLALSDYYKTNATIINGPLFREIKIHENKVAVYFDYADGLYFKNGNSNQFEISGADGKFYPAKAFIKNNTVILNTEKVKNPVKARYAWKNNATADLFNNAALPASSFLSE